MAEKSLKQVGLSLREYRALVAVSAGGANQRTLADAIHVNRNAMVGILDALCTRGLVERKRNSKDRREHIVELTATGRALLSQANEVVGGRHDSRLSILSDRELDIAKTILSKVI